MKYQDINSLTVDDWCRQGWEWGKPVSHEEYVAATRGEIKVYLTPTRPVPENWFKPLKGAAVLGLASGGAQQIPLFCAAGAKCTVLDYSAEQCRAETEFADREGYSVCVIRADMTEPLPFPDNAFDMVFHPVSNCYIEKVEPVFKECFRVLKRGGILLCGLDNGINFILDPAQREVVNSLPYNPLKDKSLFEEGLKRGEGVQFSHTAEEQIGGQLKAGFILTDIYEDTDREGNIHGKTRESEKAEDRPSGSAGDSASVSTPLFRISVGLSLRGVCLSRRSEATPLSYQDCDIFLWTLKPVNVKINI